MAFTKNTRVALQETGSADNTWGQVLNKNFELHDIAIAGTTQIVLAANDYELSANEGSEDEARAAVLDIQGQPTEDLNVIVPSVSKLYIVRNNTTGPNKVSVRTKLGSGVSVPQDEARHLYCDGDSVDFAAKAEDTKLVAGMVPGTVVERNVNERNEDDTAYVEDTVLDLEAMDQRYVPAGSVSSIGNFTTGDVKITFKKAEEGWVTMNDSTIGPENSGATARANDDTEALYTLLWNNVDDEWAPVSGGRGATAENDFNAGKPLKLPKQLGMAVAGAGSGDTLTSRDLGENLGEEEHTMTVDELVTHSHKHAIYGDSGDEDSDIGASNKEENTGSIIDTEETGGGEPFNVMQPTAFRNFLIKL